MGALLFLRHAVRVTHAHPGVWLLAPLPVAAFALCVVAGVLLWQNTPRGHVLTVIALALQVPVIHSATFGYYFNVGIGLRILLAPHRLSWFAFWGSELHVMLRDGAPRTAVGVNLVALAFCVLVWMTRPFSRPLRGEAYESGALRPD